MILHRLKVYENRVLRRKCEVEGWKILHNEELHYLYGSPNIIKVIKSRRMRWTGYVVRMG
jgi:hypothetical protein